MYLAQVMNRSIRILKHYLDKGHIIYGDNFYTSLELVQYLTNRNTGYVGTLRKNRDKERDLDKGMEKGDLRYYINDNYPNTLLTIWYDSIIVKTLSNCKNTVFTNYKVFFHSQYKSSPLVFKDYNKKAKGVDLANHLVAKFRNKLRTHYWWGTIFNHFLMVSINNAFLIYKHNRLKEMNSVYKDIVMLSRKLSRIMKRKQFILIIIKKLIYSNGDVSKLQLETHYKDHKVVLMNPEVKEEICEFRYSSKTIMGG